MKLIAFLKYVIRSASYGVLVAVILILTVPELRNQLANNKFLVASKSDESPLSYAKAVQLAGPAVVNIYSSDIEKPSRYGGSSRQLIQLGSGVIMAEEGYILTNYHVVQNADLIEVLLQNGQKYPAELIGFDVFTDLAVLKVNALNLPVIPQKQNLASVAGDVVLAIGNPLNLGQTVTQGIISGTGRHGLSSTNYLEFLQMDAAINEGNSGGALVNTHGELVGINSRKFSNPQLNIQGIFFAVPYQLARKVMEKIIEHGRVTRGWLGINAQQNPRETIGFTIGGLADGGPAFKAGLKAGDVVVEIEGEQISSIPQALDIIAETTPNTELQFVIYRKGRQMLIPVIIGEFSNVG